MGTLDGVYLPSSQINFMNVHNIEATAEQHVAKLSVGLGTSPGSSEPRAPPCRGLNQGVADCSESTGHCRMLSGRGPLQNRSPGEPRACLIVVWGQLGPGLRREAPGWGLWDSAGAMPHSEALLMVLLT